MSIRLDSDIRPADQAPPYCSSCRQQQPEKRHIDFDAPCDRGMTYGGEGATPVPLDWLILCEDCLRVASEQVGMVSEAEAEGLKEAKDVLDVQLGQARRNEKKAQEYADRLEDAFGKRAQPIEIDHRRKPRQRSAA